MNIKSDTIFIFEINNFSEKFSIINEKGDNSNNENFQLFWKAAVGCVTGFLIKKSHSNSRRKKENSKEAFNEEIYSKNDFILLREIGRGGFATVYLVYHIEKEEIFALKSPFNSDCESIELIERERSNYLNIRFPFIVKYFGYIEQGNIKCLLLEFVKGKTLKNYDSNQLSYREKCNAIFELILTVQYIHSFGYICRDMHLENIIINENKDAVLIDFDRVIKIEEQKTKDFALIDLPELELDENLTYKSDICLLGYVSYYILIGEKPRPIKQHELIYDLNDFPKKFLNEKLLFESCFYKNPEKRPDMNQMFRLLYHHFLSSIQEQGRKEQDLLNVFESNS